MALPASLDSFSHFPHVSTRLVHIACSRQVPPRRLNQLAPEIVSTSPEGLCLYCEYKNSLLVRLGRQREPSLPHGLMHAVQSSPQGFTCASAHSSEKADYQPWFSLFVRRTEHFHLPLTRSEPCRMAETRTGIHVNRDRQRHLLPAQSHGHRTPPAQNRKALTTRKETMSDIWSSPVLKP
jgi:hypothetical protein